MGIPIGNLLVQKRGFLKKRYSKAKDTTEGIDLRDQFRTRPIILQEIKARLELSKLGAAVAALLAKHDVGAASAAATNAVENNAAPSLILSVGAALSRLASVGAMPIPDGGFAKDIGHLKKDLGIIPEGDETAETESSSEARRGPGAPDPDPEDDKGKQHKGVRIDSKQIWRDKSNPKARIDVENPNPAQREGQIHYQDGINKYIYDLTLGIFRGAPRRINDQLKQDSTMQKAIQKALEKYLGK